MDVAFAKLWARSRIFVAEDESGRLFVTTPLKLSLAWAGTSHSQQRTKALAPRERRKQERYEIAFLEENRNKLIPRFPRFVTAAGRARI